MEIRDRRVERPAGNASSVRRAKRSVAAPQDGFAESEASGGDLVKMKHLSGKVASKVLGGAASVRAGGVKAMKSVLDLEHIDAKAQGTVYDASSRTFYTTFSEGDKSYVAAFGEDGSMKFCREGKGALSDIVIDGRGNFAYRNADDVVFCDGAGNEKWSIKTENQFWKPLACSNPAVGPDGTVYFVKEIYRTEYLTYSNEPNLLIIAAKDGKELWQHGFRGNQNSRRDLVVTRHGAILVNDMVFRKGILLESNNEHLLGLGPDGAVRFSTKAGSEAPVEKHSFFEEYRPHFTETPQGDIVAVHNGDRISVFDLSGKQLRHMTLEIRDEKTLQKARMMIAGRPVVDSAGNIYVRGELLGFRGAKTQLFCLDPELRLKWHRQLPPGGSEPRIDEGKCLVYVGCEGGKFVGLDKSTGKVLEERTVAQVSRGDIQLGDHVMIRTGAGTFLLDAVKTKAAARIHRLSLKGEQCGVWPA